MPKPFVVVTNTEPRLHSISLGLALGRIQLKPGANIIQQSLWAEAEKIKAVQTMLADERLKTGGELPADSLSGLTEKAAVALVNDTLDLAALRRWGREDKRDAVVRAIDRQIDKIDKAAAPPSGQKDAQPWQGAPAPEGKKGK